MANKKIFKTLVVECNIFEYDEFKKIIAVGNKKGFNYRFCERLPDTYYFNESNVIKVDEMSYFIATQTNNTDNSKHDIFNRNKYEIIKFKRLKQIKEQLWK